MKTETATTFAAQAWDFLLPIISACWDGFVIMLGFAWDVVVWVAIALWMLLGVVWHVVSVVWSAANEYLFPMIWPLIEPVFGPVATHFQAHTWHLWVIGFLSVAIAAAVIEMHAWSQLTPEQKQDRREAKAERQAEAQAKWEAEAPMRKAKKKANAAKRQAEDDNRRVAVQRESDDYFAWRAQQRAY